MNFKLMYITNDEDLAICAENAGVDWIFVDLEINGKEDRQGHLDTVISRHSIDDVKKIKAQLSHANLLVRVNPVYESSQIEIDEVIEYGADIVMLPYFKNATEVKEFIEYVDGRAKTCLLLETKEAVDDLENILSLKGIDYIHIGLNDLHLSYNMKFMFEPLSHGIVENIIEKIKLTEIEYGFGGIASMGNGKVPAEDILHEHLRLGSTMTILSRSFYCDKKGSREPAEFFEEEIFKIRRYMSDLYNKDSNYFFNKKIEIHKKINDVMNN